MHRSDKLGLRIILGGLLLIGGTYLLFQLFGDSRVISFIALGGWLVLVLYILKFFAGSKNKE